MRSNIIASVIALVLVAIMAACHSGTCSRHSDCPAGETCSVAGICTGGSPEDANATPVTDAGADGAASDSAVDGGP